MAIIEPQLVKRVNMRLVALVAFLLLVGLFVQYSRPERDCRSSLL